MKLYYIQQYQTDCMMESESPRKNLWKNIKTEKTKLSGVDQSNNPPVIINTNYSEPKRSFAPDQQMIINRHHFALELQFPSLQKQLNFHQQSSKHHEGLSINSHGLEEPHQSQANRLRRLSLGEESIVQQIVDFKNPNSLEIGDFEEEQQPMIMSLGSQSNPAIRLLKLHKVKEDLERLQSSRIEILQILNREKQQYNQAFEKTFHELLTYVISFYSDKFTQQFDTDNQRNSLLLSDNIRISIGSEDTPRFAKLKSKKSSKKSRQQKEKYQIQYSFQQQIQKLQQQLFKAKLQNQSLADQLTGLMKENQQMNESMFDYEQKIAQFELEVNKRVQQIMQKKVNDLVKIKCNEQAQSDRQYYLDQILSLEKEIQVLEKNSYSQAEYLELNQIGQQLEKKSQFLNQRELLLIDKEKQLSQFQVEINSQKLQIEKRIKNIQAREVEMRSLQSKLQQKQIELALKQKQLSNRSFQAGKESSVMEKTNIHHRRRDSNDQEYEYNDFKIKNTATLKSNDVSQNRYGERQKSPTYAGIQAKIWNRTLGQKNQSKLKMEAYLRDKNNSKQKTTGSYEKSLNLYNHNRPGTSKVHNSSSYSSKTKQQDKSRLEDLGTKLESLRNQIRKEIRDTQ